MNNTELLRSAMQICGIHADRLSTAVSNLEKITPFTTDKFTELTFHELAVLEMLTGRFAKLQDLIGDKIFKLLLIIMGEYKSDSTFIDRLNLLEKLEILPSREDWEDMRDLRNHIVHEYPDDLDLVVENLNKAMIYAKQLVDYWLALRIKILTILMMIPHKPFYFLRHGQTDWNLRGIVMGKSDIGLNQTGIEQAQNAARCLVDEAIEHIVTSPMLRAVKTAQIIAQKIHKPITIVDDLAECGWGVMEGQPVDDGTLLHEWLHGREHEGAEKVDDFGARVARGLSSALAIPGPVLIVSHRGVYGAIQKALGGTIDHLENCTPIHHRPPEHPTHPWFVCDLGE